MLCILRSLGRARSLVLGTVSGPSKSSRVDCLENSMVASVQQLAAQTVTKTMLNTNDITLHGLVQECACHAAKHRHRDKRFREKIRICLGSLCKCIFIVHSPIHTGAIEGQQLCIHYSKRYENITIFYMLSRGTNVHRLRGFIFSVSPQNFQIPPKMLWEVTSSVQILFC